MALGKSNLLIRDYDNIRDILRNMYIFGCFTRDDYIEMGYGGRKYDNEQRRINAYLPERFISKRRIGKKVIQYCKYNVEDGSENYLEETYRNKSFTMLDIMAYFFVLQILSDGEERTLPELLDELPIGSGEVMFTKDNLRVKLDELLETGLIQARKDGRNVRYSLSDDIWADLSDDELKDIYIYLEFLRNTSPLSVPYYYLQRKLKLYMFSERGISLKDESIFKFRQNHLFDSLDNDVLLVCLQGIYLGLTLNIEKMSGHKHTDVLPIKIVHDSTYGRQYLVFYNPEFGSTNNIRIDRIKDVNLGRKLTKEEENIIEKNKAIVDKSWCTSVRQDGEQEIVIEFYFDENKEDYILKRIKREGHNGTVEKKCDGVYVYKNIINDPNEMIPWIRSFGERAKVISSGSANTEKTIEADWERAVEKYESLS